MEPEKANGRVGLTNLGNTCFLNAGVQVLRYCPELVAYFHSDAYKQHMKADRKSTPIVEEVADVVKGLWRDDIKFRASMAPRGFVSTANRLCQDSPAYEDLATGGQQDASEFINFVLESLHMGLARQVQMEIVGNAKTKEDDIQIKALEAWTGFYKKEYSPIVENFFGQTMMTTTCDGCKFKGVRFEPWMMLKCPLPSSGTTTIDDCIGLALKSETVEDYKCDECKTRGTATRESFISRLPLHMIVMFKRFENSAQKIRTKVEFDLNNVDMSRWIAFPGVLRNAKPNYNAYGIVEHHGISRGGHYIAYTKHNDGWLNYDDTSITPAATASIVNQDTYVVMLTRKDYVTPPLFVKEKREESRADAPPA
jgi:ubiquitin C-terminal hydrolase